jgi:hypothetical protein
MKQTHHHLEETAIGIVLRIILIPCRLGVEETSVKIDRLGLGSIRLTIARLTNGNDKSRRKMKTLGT